MSVVFLLAGLALGPVPALAQNSQAPAETPAADAVGPRELENFSLQGTVTRQAEQPAAVEQRPARPPAVSNRTGPSPSSSTRAPDRQVARAMPEVTSPIASRTAERPPAGPRQSDTIVNLPVSDVASTAPTAEPAFADAMPDAPPELAADDRLPLWPWLLAAMALGAGVGLLFWRRRHREAIADGPSVDAFVAPQPSVRSPSPELVPAPAPKPPAPLSDSGIVSTRLRPWIDLTFEPRRCIVEDERVTFEFDLSMMNSGSAPARDVLIEASTFNAGPTQDQEIEAFFSSPVGQGERIATIPPLKSFNLRTQVSVARNQVRVLEAGGRHVFVPLMAFNAIYRWGGGEGQTSEAFLLGRDTQGEKMAPFRLDLGSRVFRGVGKRSLPAAVRR